MKNTFYCKVIFRALSALIFISAFASCTPQFYKPNVQNILVLKEKGDLAASLNSDLNFDSGTYNFGFQGAYAFKSNLGVGLNVDAIKVTAGKNGGKGSINELGLCYFKELAPGVNFNNYLWLGLGNMENHFYGPTKKDTAPRLQTITANLSRIGIQPSISLKHNWIGLTIGARISSLSYSNIKGDLDLTGTNALPSGYLKNNKSSILLEPSATLKFGKEHFNVFLQYQYSANLSHSDFPQEDKMLGFGFSYTFNTEMKN